MQAPANKFTVNPGMRILMMDLGLNVENVLRRAGLPLDLFARHNAQLAAEDYFRIWVAADEEANDPLLPLKLGQAISVESFDPPIFACFCSPELTTAFQRLAQYKALVGPMIMNVSQQNGETTVTVKAADPDLYFPKQMARLEVIFKIQLVRMATRERIVPLRVTCPVDFDPLQDYVDWIGVAPEHGDIVSVTFSAEDSKRPFLSSNPAMWDFFEPELRQRLANVDSHANMTARVQAALHEMLPGGQRSIDDVASRLAVSKRSLQRRLKEEGASYQQVLNTVREQLARHYLEKSHMSGGEISFMLGYDDPNSFFRAFHNWTGQTPDSVRQAARLH